MNKLSNYCLIFSTARLSINTKYIVLSALLVVSVASAHGSLEDLIIKSDYQQFKQELQNQQLSESEKEALIALADDIIMNDRKNLELDLVESHRIKSVIIPGVMLCLLDQMYRALRIDNIMRMESPALVEIIEPTRGNNMFFPIPSFSWFLTKRHIL